MWILDIRVFTIKMPGSVTHIILSFSVTFLNPKSGIDVNDRSYVLIFTIFAKNQADDTTAVTLIF